MKVGIIGIAGRMGKALAMEALGMGFTPAGGPLREGEVAPSDIALFPDLASLAAASDVVIDFTTASAAAEHAQVLAKAGKPWVLGTTGLSEADEDAVTRASKVIPVVYSENCSVGITLLMEFARQMGASLPASEYDAEIIETHHRQKIDAPSGTALLLGRAVAEGRGVKLADVMVSGRDGYTGARDIGSIGFCAIRAGQVVGEHELLFASATEHVALVHKVYDRGVFAHGAMVAAKWAMGRPPGLYDMRDVTRVN
jgi:4-hydroxy-tetrahydrodipicolinate reductase